MFVKLSRICILLLLIDAIIVAIGISLQQNMWVWIAGYWVILTFKNLADTYASKYEGKNK